MGEDQSLRPIGERTAALEKENELRREHDTEGRKLQKEIYDLASKTAAKTENIENLLKEGAREFEEHRKILDDHRTKIGNLRSDVDELKRANGWWRRLFREIWGVVAGMAIAAAGAIAAGFHIGSAK